MNPLISVLIINYNGKDILYDCLKSLQKQTLKNFEIIVVDNNSSDGSAAMVEGKFPKVILIKKKKNFGFAEGNNIGFKYSKGKYILLLNNDTLVSAGLLRNLLDFIVSDKNAGIVQPMIIMKKEKKLQSGGAYLTRTGFLYYFGYAKNPNLKKYNKPLKIFSANGSCMMIKREVVEKIGLFDGKFFAYFEETDFCWRAWMWGYTTIYYPYVSIEHIGGVTSSKLSGNFVLFHSYKNRIRSLIKNLGTKELMVILPLHLLVLELSAFMFVLFGRPMAIFSMNKAIFWNILNLRGTLKLRNKIQKARIVDDALLMKDIIRKVRISYFYYLFAGLDKYHD